MIFETSSQQEAAVSPLDRAGTVASVTCAIHCALVPLVVTLAPLAGLAFLADEMVEWTLVGVAAVLGISSLCLGFREHRSRKALVVLAVGLCCVVLGRIAEERELPMALGVPLAVAGGLIVAASHVLNSRLCRACRTCSTPQA